MAYSLDRHSNKFCNKNLD